MMQIKKMSTVCYKPRCSRLSELLKGNRHDTRNGSSITTAYLMSLRIERAAHCHSKKTTSSSRRQNKSLTSDR